MLASLLLAALAAIPTQLQLHGRELKAGDIATGVPGAVVVARVARDRTAIDLTEAARRKLVANRFPGRPFMLRHRGDVRALAGAPALTARATCLRPARVIAAGEAVTRQDAEPAVCDSAARRAALRLDSRQGTMVAAEPIGMGDYLGALRLPSAVHVPAGTMMHFRTSEGPVSIDREVVTLQPGRRGRPVFARTEDGQVIAAPIDRGEKGTNP